MTFRARGRICDCVRVPEDMSRYGWTPETFALWHELVTKKEDAEREVRRLMISNVRLRARVERLEFELMRCREHRL